MLSYFGTQCVTSEILAKNVTRDRPGLYFWKKGFITQRLLTAELIYIHTLLNLTSDFRVAYAANISEHLAIRREIDHHTGNYVPYSFRTVCGFFYVAQNSL